MKQDKVSYDNIIYQSISGKLPKSYAGQELCIEPSKHVVTSDNRNYRCQPPRIILYSERGIT